MFSRAWGGVGGEPNWAAVPLGGYFIAKAVILATGTYLNGRIIVGETSYEGGPDGMFAATELAASLNKLGVQTRRFKTGTPARALAKSFDYDKMDYNEYAQDKCD